MIRYCREIEDVELVYETFGHLTTSIMKQFFFLYVIFYEYAQLGMIWFGGELTFEKYSTLNMPAYYYKMNFNDFFSSIIVLF